MAENPAPDLVPHSPGAILAAERERQGLARADIAQRLHMSVSQIEALEAGDYARLPRGTFLRGFTRNYARTLGLDAEALVSMLVEDAPRETAPRIVVPSHNIRFDPLGTRLANPYVKAAGIAAAVIVLGFATMYWWVFVRPQGQAAAAKPVAQAPKSVTPPAAKAEAPVAEGVPNEYTLVPAAAPESTVTMAPATQAATAAPAGNPALAPTASEPVFAEPPRAPAPGEGVIRLAFRGPAWVEITDAKGKVLVSRTHAGGSNAEVVGRPPFNAVIGNAAEVRLTYNGRAVDLEPHTRVAVARFTLQ